MYKYAIICSVSFAMMIVGRSLASVVTLTATLDGRDARPPTLSSGSGSVTMLVDIETGSANLHGNYISGLHVPSASLRGPNSFPDDIPGPLIDPISVAVNSSGVVETGTLELNTIFSGAQLSDLLSGHYTVIVDSELIGFVGANLGGTLAVPEPVSGGAFASLAVIISTRRLRRRGAKTTFAVSNKHLFSTVA